MNEVFTFAQNASPLAVIALLGVVIFIQIWHKFDLRGSNRLATNHTSCLPELLESAKRTEATMIRIEQEMHLQTNMLTEIKARIK